MTIHFEKKIFVIIVSLLLCGMVSGCGKQSDAEDAAIFTCSKQLEDFSLYDTYFIDSDEYGRYLFILTAKVKNNTGAIVKEKFAVIVWNVKNKFLGGLSWNNNKSLPFIVIKSNNDPAIKQYKEYVGWGTKQGL